MEDLLKSSDKYAKIMELAHTVLWIMIFEKSIDIDELATVIYTSLVSNGFTVV